MVPMVRTNNEFQLKIKPKEFENEAVVRTYKANQRRRKLFGRGINGQRRLAAKMGTVRGVVQSRGKGINRWEKLALTGYGISGDREFERKFSNVFFRISKL